MGKSRGRRDNNTIANSLPTLEDDFLTSPGSLTQYEDRRQWHPEGKYAPARSFNKTRHRLTVPNANHVRHRPAGKTMGDIRSTIEGTPWQTAFREPDKVLICARRQIRREVMHALKKSGRGGQKKPRYSEYSKISCRRK